MAILETLPLTKSEQEQPEKASLTGKGLRHGLTHGKEPYLQPDNKKG